VLSKLRRVMRAGGETAGGGVFRVRFEEAGAEDLARAAARPANEGALSRLASLAGDFAVEADAASGRAEVLLRDGALSEQVLPDLVTCALALMTAPRGWYFLHSGAASRDGRAVVLVGQSMSGKSSLSLALARRGFELLSDETNILVRDGGVFRVSAFPLLPQAREAAFANVPALAHGRDAYEKTSAGKWLLPSPPQARGEAPVLAGLIFLEYSASGAFRFEDVEPDALSGVFERCTSGYLSPAPGFSALLDYLLALRALCREGKVHRLVYSDGDFAKALEAAGGTAA
jgi:hypothetical protein